MEELLSKSYSKKSSTPIKRSLSTKFIHRKPRYVSKSEARDKVRELTPTSLCKSPGIILPNIKQSTLSRNNLKQRLYPSTGRSSKGNLSDLINQTIDKIYFTHRENEIIRDSVKKYENFNKSKVKEVSNICYISLTDRFKDIDEKITLLMTSEIAIKDIEEFAEHEICMEKSAKKQYRIQAKKRASPLRIRVIIEEGIKGGEIFLSQGIPRPTIKNCDESILLTSKEVIGRYFPNRERDIFFTSESIYITIEAYKDISLSFQCVFGKGTFHYNYS